VIEPEIIYCPDCGWGMDFVFFPGNNGLIIKEYCSFCGYIGFKSGDVND
jgi:hypothetical protein